MSPAFDSAFAHVVGLEGKYANLPNDAGGETIYGVTVETARRWGYTGPMKDMPLAVAKDIYTRGWWNMLNLEQVVAIAGFRVALELFECSVNLPQKRAGEFLQRALNSFNLRGAYYPDVTVDGDIGPSTLGALRAYMQSRKLLGELVLLRALNAQQGVYYLERGEVRPKNEDFTFGWFANRVVIS